MTKYFHKSQELTAVNGMANEKFAAMFPGVKGIRFDSFSKWVGLEKNTNNRNYVPVERMITYKKFPSKHECDARCLNGLHDGTCECQCGGVNHGLGAILNGLPAA